MVNRTLDLGIVPTYLKKSIVTPIYKGGSRGSPSNYRPVALTSTISKIAEKIIKKRIIDFCTENNKLNPNQHGFRTGRSCLSEILSNLNYYLEELESRKTIDVIYLDFAKAFDKEIHQILIRKLRELSIDEIYVR